MKEFELVAAYQAPMPVYALIRQEHCACGDWIVMAVAARQAGLAQLMRGHQRGTAHRLWRRRMGIA